MPIKQPERVPTMGMVRTQPRKIHPVAFQLTALRSPLHRPTPTVAPVMHIVVDCKNIKQREGKRVHWSANKYMLVAKARKEVIKS